MWFLGRISNLDDLKCVGVCTEAAHKCPTLFVMCMCVLWHGYLWSCMWRSEANIRCLLGLVFWEVSEVRLAGQRAKGVCLLSLYPQHWHYRCMWPHSPFMWTLGASVQIFLLEWQAWLSHLCSPVPSRTYAFSGLDTLGILQLRALKLLHFSFSRDLWAIQGSVETEEVFVGTSGS